MDLLDDGRRCTVPLRAARRWYAAALLPLAGWIAIAPAPRREPLPVSSLRVLRNGVWSEWWRSSRAAAVYEAPLPLLADAVRWRNAASGVEVGELRVSGPGEAWRLRVVLLRFNPTALSLTLEQRAPRGRPAWSVDSLSPSALFALNAGQFRGARPWGWLVTNGHEWQSPGPGSLGMAIVVDTGSHVLLVDTEHLPGVRRAGVVRQAFQSYPMLLTAGVVPSALREGGRGLDVSHRDCRIALGTLNDGRVLVALTRFDALEGGLGEIPFGLTTPEMAAVMGGLGARDAVMLDGGLSAQLAVRVADGALQRYRGWRRVPLALVARARFE